MFHSKQPVLDWRNYLETDLLIRERSRELSFQPPRCSGYLLRMRIHTKWHYYGPYSFVGHAFRCTMMMGEFSPRQWRALSSWKRFQITSSPSFNPQHEPHLWSARDRPIAKLSENYHKFGQCAGAIEVCTYQGCNYTIHQRKKGVLAPPLCNSYARWLICDDEGRVFVRLKQKYLGRPRLQIKHFHQDVPVLLAVLLFLRYVSPLQWAG
jgi:hypothetical protein